MFGLFLEITHYSKEMYFFTVLFLFESQSAESVGGSGSLGRGLGANSQQVVGSLNTTTGSLNKSKSLNLTSSMSLPVYSGNYDEDDVSISYCLLDAVGLHCERKIFFFLEKI